MGQGIGDRQNMGLLYILGGNNYLTYKVRKTDRILVIFFIIALFSHYIVRTVAVDTHNVRVCYILLGRFA